MRQVVWPWLLLRHHWLAPIVFSFFSLSFRSVAKSVVLPPLPGHSQGQGQAQGQPHAGMGQQHAGRAGHDAQTSVTGASAPGAAAAPSASASVAPAPAPAPASLPAGRESVTVVVEAGKRAAD
jgi:hypothetical protein